MGLDDTHPEAHRVQLERLRAMSTEQRLAMVDELSAMTTWLSREAIREQRPTATEQQVILCWIERVYGSDLARRLQPLAHRLGQRSTAP
jgi:hypothetical protein